MKLTCSMRERIVDRALADRFDPLDAAILAEEHNLAAAVYDRFVPKGLQARFKELEGWLSSDRKVFVLCDGVRVVLRFGEPRPLPTVASSWSWSAPTWKLDGDLLHRVMENAKAAEEAKGARQRVRKTLEALLASVSTDKRLLEVWPEGRPYLPTPEEPANLPAVNIEALNADLGLPKETTR